MGFDDHDLPGITDNHAQLLTIANTNLQAYNLNSNFNPSKASQVNPTFFSRKARRPKLTNSHPAECLLSPTCPPSAVTPISPTWVEWEWEWECHPVRPSPPLSAPRHSGIRSRPVPRADLIIRGTIVYHPYSIARYGYGASAYARPWQSSWYGGYSPYSGYGGYRWPLSY
jgi:hypothetical protein